MYVSDIGARDISNAHDCCKCNPLIHHIFPKELDCVWSPTEEQHTRDKYTMRSCELREALGLSKVCEKKLSLWHLPSSDAIRLCCILDWRDVRIPLTTLLLSLVNKIDANQPVYFSPPIHHTLTPLQDSHCIWISLYRPYRFWSIFGSSGLFSCLDKGCKQKLSV